MSNFSPDARASTTRVREYWNHHIHDLEVTKHAAGSPGFFADLDQYHFEKLHHLLRLVDFEGYRGRRVLEVGCGAGDLLASVRPALRTIMGLVNATSRAAERKERASPTDSM